MIVEGLGMAICDVCCSSEEVFMDHHVDHLRRRNPQLGKSLIKKSAKF
jgi:hypothetical protein